MLGSMDPASNKLPPSTTWEWQNRMIRVPAGGQKAQPAEGGHPQRLPLRNSRKPLTVTITYRGGPECWWELKARGVTIRRPGALALHDVLSQFEGTLRKKPNK